MGVIGDFIKKVTSGIGNWFTGATGSGLTPAQHEANQFSAQQAEISREWDERMYQQYNSPGALVRQYQSAGINPALMFGGQTPSAPQSSGEASSVSPSTPGFDMLSALASLANVRADIQLKKSEARKNDSQSVGNEISNQYLAEQIQTALDEKRINIDATLAGIDEINSKIGLNNFLADVYKQDAKLREKQIELADLDKGIKALEATLKQSQIDNLDYQNAYEEFKKNFREEFGTTPDEPLWNAMVSFLGSMSRRIANGFSGFANKLDIPSLGEVKFF